MTRHAAPRRGFTLIEILIVIAIIAVLVGLLVVVIPKITDAAKNTQTATDMAQISTAISTYKSKMQVGYIPSCGSGSGGLFQLKKTYNGNEPEAIYLKQVWPQLPGCNGAGSGVTGLNSSDTPINLDCNQTLVFFLTGGKVTNFQGFSTNRTNPFTTPAVGSTESRVGPFLELSVKRYAAASSVPGADTTHPTLLDPFGAPYAYFAFNPVVNTYKAPVYDSKSNSYAYTLPQAYRYKTSDVAPYFDPDSKGTKYLEPKGFQLISAGSNGNDDTTGPYGFGPGGTNWTPRAGVYDEGMAGADDLANFNGGAKLITKN